jgi:hypothetical protein
MTWISGGRICQEPALRGVITAKCARLMNISSACKGCHPIFPPAAACAPRLHLFASQRDDSAFGRSRLSTTHSNFAGIFLRECDDGTAFDGLFQFISFSAALGVTTDLNAD